MHYLTLDTVSEQLGCSYHTVLTLIRNGDLAAIDIGSGRRPRYRVSAAALADFVGRRSVSGADVGTSVDAEFF